MLQRSKIFIVIELTTKKEAPEGRHIIIKLSKFLSYKIHSRGFANTLINFSSSLPASG